MTWFAPSAELLAKEAAAVGKDKTKYARVTGRPMEEIAAEARARAKVTTLAQMSEEQQRALRAELEARELARAADPLVQQARQLEEDERRARKSRMRRRR